MKVSYDLVIFREKHQCCWLRRGAWSSFKVRVGITEEGESSVKDKILATSSETSKAENAPAEMLRDLDQQMEKRADDGKANVVTDALSRKERVKPRRVRAMAMLIQYGVRGMILAAQSEAFKQENVPLVGSEMDEAHASSYTRRFQDVKLARIYIDETIARNGILLVQETTDKVVLIKEKFKAARDRQKSYADNSRKPLEFEVGNRELLKVTPWKGVVHFGKKYASLHVPLDEIKVDKTLCFVEEPVENSDREVKRFLTSLLDDGRGSGSWMFLFVWSGYAAMRTLCGQAKLLAILRGDQLLVILCGFGTKSLEFGISFLSMTISRAASYAYSGSLLLTPLCYDDIHDVTPRISALAGCDMPLGYSQNSKAYIILNKHTRKIEESLNVTFDETPPPSKTSPLVDDDLDEEEAVREIKKKNLENVVEDETLEIDEIVNIKESRNHPLENSTIKNMKIKGNGRVVVTKWVFRNKLDENGIVSRNKARLVVQGYNQQEGIDYDETYVPFAILESIRILLAYACALDFKLFQMDVKSAFLNGFINEEVYVAQPLGFIDFEKPDHVYKLKKALYGLKQAPKAWYDRLKAFLIKHEYKMGMVDNTLFTKKKSSNLIIVQIYVNDIIFGSTCQDMCDEFAKIMHDEFEMSMMGELNFFLGLQIKQMEDGIFFNQSKYIKEMLKKFGLKDSKPMKTPMSSDTKLTKDEECESVDSNKASA
ncbi:retrovirus-related pol polyprotein from transposon TNT 1-94 [Tanacetum coccineum]